MSGTRATIGRRRFVQLMGWAGAAAVAHGGPAVAAAAQKAKTSNRPVQPPPSPTPAPESEVSDEARALREVVKHRYGDKVSAQDLEIITRDLDGDLQGIKRLREVKLANGDEPDATFRA